MTNIRLLNKLLSEADVKINGQRPWDIQLYDENAIKRIFIDGSLGFGETYMDGLWDCDQLDELINRLTSHDIERKLDVKKRLLLGASIGQEKILNIFNRQSVSQSKKDIPYHYDLGNDLFKVMLYP
ncbi:hypothetical protein AB4427_07325 [Vibrio artabrorum]|uniref:hypothetical protein n=1 Tax=Vibrio artabrorum TaxID=446374 RepID=UPI0035527361